MSGDIPATVQLFLKASFQSVSQLELLLLLYHTQDKSFTAEEAAKVQYTALGMTQAAFQRLCEIGLASQSSEEVPQYRYSPRTAELDQLIAEIAQLYSVRRVTIISMIYSSPVENLQNFADAFRIRKRESE